MAVLLFIMCIKDYEVNNDINDDDDTELLDLGEPSMNTFRSMVSFCEHECFNSCA